MTDLQVCTTCGRRLQTDDHHIAGEANNPATTKICPNGCHQFLTRRQLDNGVNLDRGVPVSDVDRARAGAHGLSDILSLSARRRHPDLVPAAEMSNICTHIATAILDLSDDPDRPGRFLPDTIGARHRLPLSCNAVEPSEGTEMQVIEQLMAAIASQGEVLETEEGELSAQRRCAENPQRIYDKVTSLLGNDPEVEKAWSGVPDAMFDFAIKFQKFLLIIKDVVSNESLDHLDELMDIAHRLAPVASALRNFYADVEGATTAEECKAAWLRLPRALGVF